MSYRELLARYRAGELDRDQEEAVRADIEKQDAISEYLCEEGEIPELLDLGGEEALPMDKGGEELAGEIHRAVRRAFVKAGVIVGASVLAVVLFVIFALPKIVDRFYYDPTAPSEWCHQVHIGRSRESTVGEVKNIPLNRIQADMTIFSDLFIPLNRYRYDWIIGSDIQVYPEGWGEYSIHIPRKTERWAYPDTVWGHISRGRIVFSDGNYYQFPWADYNLPWKRYKEEKKINYREMGRGYPRKTLDPDAWYTVYVKLEEPVSLGTVLGMVPRTRDFDDNDLWMEAWVPDEEGENLAMCVGLHAEIKQLYDPRYPNMLVGSFNNDMGRVGKMLAEMLRYVKEEPDFGLMLFQENSRAHDLLEDPERIDRVIDGLEENGFMCQRFVARARGSYVSWLEELDRVECVNVMP